jgi:DNA polymerase III epsilon subunit-like protein
MMDLLRFDNNVKILVIDFESENTSLIIPTLDVAWQVGMLKTQGNNIIDSYDSFIKWDRPLNVSEGAARVTHFDKQKVEASARDYKEVVPKVVEWTEWADWWVIHNGYGFDVYFIKYFYEIMGKSTTHLAEKIIDTHALLKGLKMNIPLDLKKQDLLSYQYSMIHTKAKGIKTNLTAVGKEMGIEADYENLHSAGNDVELLFNVWKKLKFMVEL